MAVIRSPEVLTNAVSWWNKFVLVLIFLEVFAHVETLDLGEYFLCFYLTLRNFFFSEEQKSVKVYYGI